MTAVRALILGLIGVILAASLPWAGDAQAAALPSHFALANDVAKQACRAQRVYGDPLVRSDAERAYDLFCGAAGAAVGRAYLFRRAEELEAWRKSLGPCSRNRPLAWTLAGLQQPAAVLCQSEAGSPEDDDAPTEERLTASRIGWFAAGSGLPPAAPALESAVSVLLGASPPNAQAAGAGGKLVASLGEALGGPLAGVSPNDFQSLVAAGHESNTLWLFAQAEAYFSQAIAAHHTFWPNDRLGDADLKLELALNLSNQRRFFEARQRFEEVRAEVEGHPEALAKLDLYEADDLLNDESQAARLKDAAARLAEARTELAAAEGTSSATVGAVQRRYLLEALVWRTSARVAGDPAEAQRDLQNAVAALNLAGLEDGAWLAALLAKDQARLQIAEHQPGSAVAILRGAIADLQSVAPGTRLDGDLNFELGGALAAAGDREGAIGAERTAIAIFAKQTESPGLTADQAVSYINLLLGSDAAPLGPGDDRAQALFAAFEAVSAASVRQTASAAAARLASGPDAALIRRWQDAQRASVSAAAQVNRLAADAKTTAADRNQAEAALKTAKAREEALAAEVYRRQPGYGALAQGPVSLAEIQATLDPKDILVRLLAGANGGVGLLVAKDRVTPFRFEADASKISAMVRRIKASARHENDAAAFDLAASHDLFEALFGPVRETLLDPARTRMILDVQGALAALPFGVLVTAPPPKGPAAYAKDAYAKAAWLGQRFQIVVSAGLRPLRTPTGGIKTFVGYGDFTPLAADAGKVAQIRRVLAARALPTSCIGPLLDMITNLSPLEGTKTELDTIQANLGGAIHLGEQFHPELVLADTDFAKADMVVLATHGVFRQAFPEAAGSPCLPEAALLTSAPTHDGDIFLDAPAVLSLRLAAKLAILSACDTGTPVSVSPGQTGLPSGGDALSGFARAFIYAGAQNVIVTHWPIRDEFGPPFMKALTGALKDGRSPEAALQIGQAAAIASGDYADPYYWGAFTLVSMGLRTQ